MAMEHRQNVAGISSGPPQCASKKGLDTPFETYQKLSPVAGETNAVT